MRSGASMLNKSELCSTSYYMSMYISSTVSRCRSSKRKLKLVSSGQLYLALTPPPKKSSTKRSAYYTWVCFT